MFDKVKAYKNGANCIVPILGHPVVSRKSAVTIARMNDSSVVKSGVGTLMSDVIIHKLLAVSSLSLCC